MSKLRRLATLESAVIQNHVEPFDRLEWAKALREWPECFIRPDTWNSHAIYGRPTKCEPDVIERVKRQLIGIADLVRAGRCTEDEMFDFMPTEARNGLWYQQELCRLGVVDDDNIEPMLPRLEHTAREVVGFGVTIGLCLDRNGRRLFWRGRESISVAFGDLLSHPMTEQIAECLTGFNGRKVRFVFAEECEIARVYLPNAGDFRVVSDLVTDDGCSIRSGLDDVLGGRKP